MSDEPRRLMDLGGPSALLVASADDDAPSAASVERAAARLGVAGVVVAGAAAGAATAKGIAAAAGLGAGGSATAAAGASKVAGMSLFAKVALGVTATFVVAGGAVAVSSPRAVEPASARPAATATAAGTAADRSRASTAPTGRAAEIAPLDVPSAEPTATATPPGPTAPIATVALAPAATTASAAPSASAAPPVRDVRDEIASLDRARAALSGGNTRGALDLLDEHQRAFPRGGLGMEAEMLRIEAMIRGDHPSEGRARGAALLSRDPNGPYAKRLRSLIEP